MANLSTCYFCGEIGNDIEEHPIIPAGLDPPQEDQQTVAVCADCRRKFDRAIEPLVAFLRETHPPGTGDGSRDGGSPSSPAGDRETAGRNDQEGGDGGGEGTVESSDGVESPDDRDESIEEGGEKSVEEGGTELPEASRDVLRLLRNREFPVDREDIETVAMSAYELGPGEVGEAIDALVQRGVLTEEDGRLNRPD